MSINIRKGKQRIKKIQEEIGKIEEEWIKDRDEFQAEMTEFNEKIEEKGSKKLDLEGRIEELDDALKETKDGKLYLGVMTKEELQEKRDTIKTELKEVNKDITKLREEGTTLTQEIQATQQSKNAKIKKLEGKINFLSEVLELVDEDDQEEDDTPIETDT